MCGLKSKLIFMSCRSIFIFFYGSTDVSFVASVTSRLKRNASSPYSWDCAISNYD